MNKIYTLLFAILILISQLSWAQKNVSLNITHLLDGSPFSLNTSVQNDLGHDLNLSRLAYYLSGIEIAHDSGKVTPVSELYALVHADQPTNIDLGNFNIDQVEAISFYVGVDSAHNHLDPAQYPMSHPLAPKSPSMHWGWAGGYRFVAIEGKSGPGLAYDFEIHGLGNNNYFQTLITSPELNTSANSIEISIEADYIGIVKGLDLSGGLINHGAAREARTALLNFRNYVFSWDGNNTSIDDELAGSRFQLFPNPAMNSATQLKLDETANQSIDVIVTDMRGRTIFQAQIPAGQQKLYIPTTEAGMYLVHVIEENAVQTCQKLVVK